MLIRPEATRLRSRRDYRRKPLILGRTDVVADWQVRGNRSMTSDASFETVASQWIHLIGVGIEIFGIFIIVAGIIWSTRYIYGRRIASRYDSYKISIGKSLLLGLEVLVAADIVKTIAIEVTFASLGLLAGLVLV